MTTLLTPRDILDQLVAFPTVSRDTNLPLIDWVEGYLNSHGITCGRQYSADGTKAGLYAHVGPAVAGGWFCPATRMWCLSMASRGPVIPSLWLSVTANCTGAAPVT